MAIRGKPRVGFIGLGRMGKRMAARLLNAGFPMTVWNRTRDHAADLALEGAKVADTARELAMECDFILSSLADDRAVTEVVFGPDGILVGAESGAYLIEMSTISPDTAREIHRASDDLGVRMLDAPVLGSVGQAEQGKLMIFVGGDEDAYRNCKPVLDVLGEQVHYLGRSGAGLSMKLVVNSMLGTGLQSLAEAIALGLKMGLDRNQLLDVLSGTRVVSPSQKGKIENARRGDYSTVAFSLKLLCKDLSLVLEQAAKLSVPMPATAVSEQMCLAESARGVEEDYSAIIRLMEELARIQTPAGQRV